MVQILVTAVIGILLPVHIIPDSYGLHRTRRFIDRTSVVVDGHHIVIGRTLCRCIRRIGRSRCTFYNRSAAVFVRRIGVPLISDRAAVTYPRYNLQSYRCSAGHIDRPGKILRKGRRLQRRVKLFGVHRYSVLRRRGDHRFTAVIRIFSTDDKGYDPLHGRVE